ncbi:GumC family protein [Cyclobacterium sp. SYSU L10401]|uniref:GumC family protein n=1 Tax=Cyclobacterium sp. SYSU L10401 TaxID=2678657 RepID=UPI0013D2AA63|nr:polysaccharide biosynthesis tyrosine autokinase [Cyclobacterium sp. SYSU L10401]
MEQPASHPFQQNPMEEEEIDLKEILFKYLRYWKVIAFCAFIGFFLAFAFNQLVTPVYKVQSSVIIKDEDSGMLGSGLFEQAGLNVPKNNVENEMGILTSFSLVYEALEKLNLNVTYSRDGFFGPEEIYLTSPLLVEVDWQHPQIIYGSFAVENLGDGQFELSIEEDEFLLFSPKDPNFKTRIENVEIEEGIYSFDELLTGTSFKFSISNISMDKGEKVYFNLKDTGALTNEFRSSLEVSPLNRTSTVLNLEIELNNRRKGENFLNQLMEDYLARELNEKNRTATNTINFIEGQLSGISDSLSFIEDRLENYRSANSVFNLTEEGTLIFQRLAELEEQKAQMDLSLSYYRSMATYLGEEELNDLVAPSFIGIQDPLLNALVISLAELQSEKVRLTASFSDETPAVREVNSKIKNTQNALSENLRNAISNAETKLSELNDRIRQVEREINRLPSTERNLLGIQRQFTINENIYVYLLEKRAEAEITRASNYPSNNILDAARSASVPVFPRKNINYLIGILFGIILPVGFITLRDLFNTKIRDPHEVEKKLRVPLIGLIGYSTAKTNLVVHSNPKSVITEAFRNLRANMSYLSMGKNKLMIGLSSSISGEGKTFCSINLAAVYALSGKKVLLVGLDLRKPRIADDFDLSNDRGVSTYLKSETDWKPLVHQEVKENLDILLSGPIPPNPAELMLQDRFSYLMEEIREAYDIVILDCPPVGLVSETLEIFKYSQINLMILRQEFSEKSACDYINSLQEQNGVKKLYAVMNGVVNKSKYGGYGKYGYGGGYGYGSKGYGYHEEMPSRAWWRKWLPISV